MNVCFKLNGKEVFTKKIDTLLQLANTTELLNNRYKNDKLEITLISKDGKEQLLEVKGLIINSVA